MKDQIQEIKSKMSVLQYARDILNIPVVKAGDRYKSFKPSSVNKTCCVFHNDFFFDFNLNMGGDLIDLCAFVNHGGNKGSAIKELSNLTGVSFEYNENWVKKTQDFGDRCVLWHDNLKKEDRKYLNKRGINDKTIDRIKIGTNRDRINIPIWKNGQIVFYAGRGESPKYKNCSLNEAPNHELVPYGFNTIGRDAPLIITEGVLDGVVCDQEGFQTIALLGGHMNANTTKQLIGICKSTKEDIILVFDKDENGAGQKFLLDIAKKLFSYNVDFYVYDFEKNEDVNEMFLRVGNLGDLVEGKRSGVEFIAEKIKDKKEFKSFVRNASKFVGKAELAEIFDLASQKNFSDSKSWIKEVRKQALACPTDDFIVKEIVKKLDIIFKEGYGFYEYSAGCWRQRADKEIESIIADSLGNYRTGGKISSILSVLKSEVFSNVDFNKTNHLNFINGMFNLDNGEIESHDKEYYSSIQLTYSYNKENSAERWKQFICEVTNNNVSKMNILQEMAGYVMFPDNRLHKALILIGNGSNGKSVYLETLIKVFGKDNCTSVEIVQLVNDFQRYMLKDSLLNISTEMDKSVKGAEASFKNIVAGEPITGCQKHKPFISFRTRSKMLFATNNMIRPSDVSDGFIRRLLFVKFDLKFVSRDIKYKNERKADINLIKKLDKELSGIFNWAYEGYLRLLKNNKFTHSEENEELVSGMVRQTSHINAMIEDLEDDISITSKGLYIRYQNWCNKNGYKNISPREEFLIKARTLLNSTKDTKNETFVKKYLTF